MLNLKARKFEENKSQEFESDQKNIVIVVVIGETLKPDTDPIHAARSRLPRPSKGADRSDACH